MTRILLLLLVFGVWTSAAAQTARDTLEMQLAQGPDNAPARRALSDLLTAQGDPGAAVPHLAWLAEHAPGDADLHRLLARNLLWSDRASEAAEVLAQVVALDSADVGARIQIAEIVTWEGGADRAVALLAPVADAHPDDARLHRILAFALVASGDPGARDQLTRALALSPNDTDLLVEGGALERWQGDWSLAQRRLHRAVERGLTDLQAGRVRLLLDGIRGVSAASVTLSAVRLRDSNAIRRTDSPGRLDVPVDGRWTVGAEIGRGEIQAVAGASATSSSFVPYAVYQPSRAVRLDGALGVEGTPGAPLAVVARASGQRVWTRRGFALARLSGTTAIATDAATALDRGLRRSSLTAEGYAEPGPSWSVSGLLSGLAYSDGNQRVQAAGSARWLPLSTGARAEGLPLASAGLTAGALYEDTRVVYADALPYYTPDDLLTVSAGFALRVTGARGLRLDGTLGAARQSGGSTSAEYGAVLALDRGTEEIRVEVRRTGSAAYSSTVAGLTVRFRLP